MTIPPNKITFERLNQKAKEKNLKILFCKDKENAVSRDTDNVLELQCNKCDTVFKLHARSFWRSPAEINCPCCKTRNDFQTFYLKNGSKWYCKITGKMFKVPPTKNAYNIIPFFINHLKEEIQNNDIPKDKIYIMEKTLQMLKKDLDEQHVYSLKDLLNHSPNRQIYVGFSLLRDDSL